MSHLNLPNMLVLLLISITIQLASNQRIPSTPCPDTFNYENYGDKIIGVARLSAPIDQQNMTVQVEMHMPKTTKEIPGDIGLYTERNTLNTALKRINDNDPTPIVFKIILPFYPLIPELGSIYVNQELRCLGRPATVHNEWTSMNLSYVIYSNNYNNNNYQYLMKPTQRPTPRPYYNSKNNPLQYQASCPVPTPCPSREPCPVMICPASVPCNCNCPSCTACPICEPRQACPPDFSQCPKQRVTTCPPPRTIIQTIKSECPSAENDNNLQPLGLGDCGKPYFEETSPLIFHGQAAKVKEWPWLAAIYTYKLDGLAFICGGVLITRQHVITAAHCRSEEERGADSYLVYLGKFLTAKIEKFSQPRNVREILPHPAYRKENIHSSDVMVFLLDTPATYTQYVRPICIWPLSFYEDSSVIEKLNGTVVGWGANGALEITRQPYVIRMPVLSVEECKKDDPNLGTQLTASMICGGTRDGRGPCTGDSGGGLYVYYNDKWWLRGIVSFSTKKLLANGETNDCDTSRYSVFTDVLALNSWVHEAVKKLK